MDAEQAGGVRDRFLPLEIIRTIPLPLTSKIWRLSANAPFPGGGFQSNLRVFPQHRAFGLGE